MAPAIGSSLAGFFLAVYPGDQLRITIAIYIFTRALEFYYNYLEEQNQIRKDPKLAKKIGSYTGPHTKTQALLNDLHEFRLWSEQHPDQRPIKR